MDKSQYQRVIWKMQAYVGNYLVLIRYQTMAAKYREFSNRIKAASFRT